MVSIPSSYKVSPNTSTPGCLVVEYESGGSFIYGPLTVPQIVPTLDIIHTGNYNELEDNIFELWRDGKRVGHASFGPLNPIPQKVRDNG